VGERFYYAVFIIDVYTKKIVGYKVSSNMRATANFEALAMALRLNAAPLIHHSDRGSQYGSTEYITSLKRQKTRISMGLIAQENAYAERINRTIKEEYLDYWKPSNFGQLKQQVKKAVDHYNNHRPHNHLARQTPTQFENMWFNDPAFNKPDMIIFDEAK
jgi:putative transposase